MSLDTLETFPTGTERMGVAALGRASLVYALGGLAYKGVALVTIPILARLLSPAQLGLLDLAAVLASIVGLVAVAGTDQGVAFYEPRERQQGELWASAVTVVAAGAAALAGLVFVLRDPLATILTDDGDNGPIVAAAAVYGGVIALSAVTLIALRLHASPRVYALGSFAIVAAEMVVALSVAWLLEGAVAAMVLGWAVGAAVVSLPLLVRFIPSMTVPDRSVIRRLLGYGAPLIPAAIAWLVGDAVIRSAISREVGLTALGEYGIAYRVASVLGLVVTGFGVAWYPYLYRSPATDVVPRAGQALGVLVLALAVLGVVVTALSPELIAVIAGEGYAGAVDAIGPLAGGMVALGAFVLVSAVIGSEGSTRRVAIAAVLGAATQWVLSAWLVDAHGLAGAGLASLGGYTLAVAILFGTERRLLHAASGWTAVLVAGVAAAGLVGASSVTGGPTLLRVIVTVGFAAVALSLAAVLASRRVSSIDA